ncbi:alpha/beta hydrolase [Nocardia otitidiscaviarum]|uniref:alpha/beta hydrolase n=1 Tax=Nocardia otitidiscaviarum TaxID=1823 RepID=UPI001E44999F|nr:alpha/beta hydrolase [Nocardia otitidiscaviarum]
MRRGALLAATLLAGMLLTPTAPATAEATAPELVAQADAAPTPILNWATCAEPGLDRFQCATARVPLDYAKPDGATLDLAVVRQPVTDPDRRIGTLFSAVGGPGGSGIDAARDIGLGSPELAQRFDLVTFDQRGIGRSAQVRCFADTAAQEDFWSRYAPLPTSERQYDELERLSRELADGCAAHSGELLPHLTTVDAARDLDLLRRAVGDATLTYTGGSYASYLGEVYGALFGDRVRALGFGAMIEPVGYTEYTLTSLAEAAIGTEQVLTEFARLCAEAGSPRCAFADGEVRARNLALLDRLREGPITVGSGDTARPVTYAEFLPAQVFLLYDPDHWSTLGTLLAEVDRGADGDPGTVAAILDATPLTAAFMTSFTAITCADVRLPKDPGLWPTLARAIESAAPTFGSYWLYPVQACGAWHSPADGYPQRYTGPWTLDTDTPALLTNARFDPATPLFRAERARQVVGNARLVVLDGYGHTTSSTCTRELGDAYLIDLTLPAPGTTCPADRAPFT